ncbi:riboflavin synthase [Synechococcus sp. PCC 7336]|uniref:riboflavin synthase n=1 Tax=Synechococcus sp. PCC 7336 TaxID=195250 RepID=UPI00034921F4|nr:riboflavin synthase [Synechococcus sp. PCC 7336]
MFTGLIQATGRLQTANESQVRIHWLGASPQLLGDLELGDSVAVDGVCLTVARGTSDGFIADVSPETLARTTLVDRPANHLVNLERSLRVGGKVGGHFVTGHIDGIGYFGEGVESGAAWELSFRVPERVAKYIVPKGSIAINGISLTVADMEVGGSGFKVAVIPHTYELTNLSALKPGDPVNLEGDILGKYVEQFLLGRRTETTAERVPVGEPALDLSFLSEHGFL